jgi:hypothetical protein
MKEKVLKIMETFQIAGTHEVADQMTEYKKGPSRYTNANKHLEYWAGLKKIEKCDGFWRMPGCRAEYSPHTKALTIAIGKILKVEATHHIHREYQISEIGLRPDLICFLTRGDKAICFLLEICLTEKESYTEMKERAFKDWPDKLKFLSDLFHYPIPHYDFIADRGTELDHYIKEVIR